MTIEYWTSFSKRKNSTKQPASSGTSATVQLKEGTSIESPVFLLSGDLFTITYVNAFGHYYFVTDVRSVRNGLTEIYCKMDPLATFKSDIGSYTALVERSDSHYDLSYPDPAVSIKNEMSSAYAVGDPNLYSSVGCFAVSVLNDIGSGTGFTSTYIMESGHLELLAKYVNTNWGSALGPGASIVDWLQAYVLKTADCIIDCIWLPIAYSDINITAETIKVGVDNVVVGGFNVEGKRLTGPLIRTATVTVAIPHVYTAGDFRRCAPYTNGKIFIPGYGTSDFNPIDFEPTGNMDITTSIDMATGDIVVYLSNADGVLVSSYNFNIGVSCPVGKVGSNVTETLGGILSVASNIVTARVPGNRYAEVSEIAAVASGINTMSSALGVTPSYSGRKGGRAAWNNNTEYAVEIFAHDTQSLTSMQATSGRPDMTERQLSTCSDFVKCINASVPINGMDAERDEINSFLNSGFYYE